MHSIGIIVEYNRRRHNFHSTCGLPEYNCYQNTLSADPKPPLLVVIVIISPRFKVGLRKS